jgi:hypothetical protein
MRRILACAALLSLGIAACATSQTSRSDRMAGLAPMLSVERFLQAVNTHDLEAMAQIFGTASGPIADQAGSAVGCAFRRMGSWVGLGRRCVAWREIELRMDAISMILRHDDYRIRGESNVAGRRHPTTRVGVDLVQGSERFENVPFVVVETPGGRWLLEEIGLERVTGARGR